MPTAATSKVERAAGLKPPNAGKGRKKGVPNKVTRDLRQMVLGALATAGGQAYLARQAKDNPVAFMSLLGKVLPHSVNLAGAEGAPLSLSVVFQRQELE